MPSTLGPQPPRDSRPRWYAACVVCAATQLFALHAVAAPTKPRPGPAPPPATPTTAAPYQPPAADPCAPWPAVQAIHAHSGAMRTQAAAAEAKAWLARCEAAAGKDEGRKISALQTASLQAELAGEVVTALAMRRRLVAIVDALPPHRDLSRSSAHLLLGTSLLRLGERSEAITELQRSEAEVRADLTQGPTQRAGLLQPIAMMLGNLQRYGPALRLLEEARALFAADPQTMAMQLVGIDVSVASLHWMRGDLATAQALMQKVVERCEASLREPLPPAPAGSTPQQVAVHVAMAKARAISPVAIAYWHQMVATLARMRGEHATAAKAQDAAGAIFRAELERNRPLLGGPQAVSAITAMTALAGHEQQQRRWAEADALYLEARAAAAAWPQVTKPYLEGMDQQRARLLIDAGRATGDRQRLVAAAELMRPQVAEVATRGAMWTLNAQQLLSEALHLLGDFAAAVSVQEGVVRAYDGIWGPRHPVSAVTRGVLADTLLAAGRPKQVLPVLAALLRAVDGHLAWVQAVGSEEDLRSALDAVRHQRDRLLTVLPQVKAARAAKPDEVDAMGYGIVLRHKGRLLDVLARALQRAERRGDPETRRLIARLRAVRAELAALGLQKPVDDEREAHLAKIAALEDEARRLDLDLAARSPALAATTGEISIAALQKRLPARSALVEYAFYRQHDIRSRPSLPVAGAAPPPGHFCVFILPAKGPLVWLDLGPAAAIEEQVAALRKSLQRPKIPGVQQRARALDASVFEPLLPHLAGADTVLVAADGALDLVPFGALVAADGRYRLEAHTFVALSSGRDLLRLDVRRPPRGGPVIFGDPAFGTAPEAPGAAPPTELAPDASQRSGDFASMRWSLLPGSAEEAAAIAAELPGATLHMGTAASEPMLRAVRAPSLLHIATHGFFLPRQPDLPAVSQQLPENPLIRSGIVLAGVGLPHDDALAAAAGDGVLTALEAGDLDLDGTQLVVLSACETAVGELREGDGVQGLRRSLSIAGAEALVSSLWKVDDAATRDLMVAMVRQLKQNSGRAAALRAAQLQALQHPATRHPYFWAAFVLAGRWDAMAGVVPSTSPRSAP